MADWGRLIRNSGGGCDSQSAIIDIYVLGKPTSGSFIVYFQFNSVTEPVTFHWDDDSTDSATAIAVHSELAPADVVVSGGAFPAATMRFTFQGDQARKDIAVPTTDWTNLIGGVGVAVIPVLARKGHA
jgi:hypothetical protein